MKKNLNSDLPPSDKRLLNLTKQYTFFAIIANILFGLNDIFIGQDDFIIAIDILVIIFHVALHIYFLYTANQKITAVILIVSLNLWLFFNSGYYGKDANIYFFFFTLIFMTFFLVKLRDTLLLFSLISLPILCLLTLEFTDHSLFLNENLDEGIIEDTRKLTVFVNIFLYIIFIRSIILDTLQSENKLIDEKNKLEETKIELEKLNESKTILAESLEMELKEKVMELNVKQRELEAAMIKGEETERNRLANELHDGLGALLSTIKLNLMNTQDADKENKKYENAIQLIDQACNEIRDISQNLQPTLFSHLGLVNSLYDLVKKINQSGKLKVRFNSFDYDKSLSEEKELILYRITSELLNNIIKHSNATEAVIQILDSRESITLIAEDNGKGFKSQDGSGIGMKSIDYRAQLLDGRFYYESNDEGTVSIVEIPVKK